jgi:integrase
MIQNTATKPVVAVPGYSRLFRRGAIYYFRVVVPRELRSAIGKSEIVKSLRTANFNEAKRLVAFESADADGLFHSARVKLHRVKSPRREVSKLSDAEIHRLVMEWFIQIEKRSEDSWQNEGRHLALDERQEALENLGIEETALTAVWGDGGACQPIDASRDLDQFLSQRGIDCARDSAEYRKLTAVFHRGRIENVRRDIARIEGKPRPAEDLMFRDLSAYTLLSAAQDSITLGELLNRFLAYVQAKRSETTFSTYQTPARVMREVLGEATPLHSITRGSIDRLFDLLRNRPQNTSQRYRGLTTEQAISAAAARGDNLKLSPKSLENYYTNILAVFNFAVDEKLIAENPAKFRSLREQFRTRTVRKKALFSPEQLSQIFHSPVYERPFQIGDAHSGRFFVPLLALFHGFRCNEACQLYTEDVKQERGIPFLAIREEREDGSQCEKRLKNEASKRNVPIHPILLRAGFMEFVAERRRDSASPRLFLELPLGKTRRYSNPFSKWFTRYLRSIFDVKPAATFHSFRHHFRDALRAGRVGTYG